MPMNTNEIKGETGRLDSRMQCDPLITDNKCRTIFIYIGNMPVVRTAHSLETYCVEYSYGNENK